MRLQRWKAGFLRPGKPLLWSGCGKNLATLPRAVELGLPVVIDAIVVMEQFHEAVLAVFETLLWWGTQNAGRPVADLVVDSDFRKAGDRCRETAGKLREFREGCERLDVRDAIDGLAGFCFQVDRCRSSANLSPSCWIAITGSSQERLTGECRRGTGSLVTAPRCCVLRLVSSEMSGRAPPLA